MLKKIKKRRHEHALKGRLAENSSTAIDVKQ